MAGSASQVRLTEAQNETFDQEYFGAQEFPVFVEEVRRRFARPVRLLDVGGGSGRFCDAALAALDVEEAVNLDVSRALLARNAPHPRKRTLEASILERPFREERFDVVALNWVLHHMIARGEAATRAMQVETLRACAEILGEGGILLVSENDYRSWVSPDHSGRLIYHLTRSKLLAPLTRRFANTAGVGVRFRPERGWRALFHESGLRVERVFHGSDWEHSAFRRFALGMRPPRHVHFILTRM